MKRAIGVLSVLSITVLGLGMGGGHPLRQPLPRGDSALRLKEESMIIDYAPALGEATLVVEAESETTLSQVEVLGPHGERVFRLNAGDRPLQGFQIEAREKAPEVLFETYSQGIYALRAQTVDNRPVVGSARLSHELLAAPVVILPRAASTGVPTNLVVTWAPDPLATAYRVTVEQDENDGLTATLPPGTTSFQVPFGILTPGTDSHVEVAVVAASGNRTMTEVEFRTL